MSISLNCIRSPALAGVSFSSRGSDSASCPYRRSPFLLQQRKPPTPTAQADVIVSTLCTFYFIVFYVAMNCGISFGAGRRKPQKPCNTVYSFSCFFFLFITHIYFPASGQAVGSQVSSLLPPGACLQLLSRMGFSNPTARRFFIECC